MNKLINTVIYGECIEEMQKLPSNSIDLIFCDLPFGITQNEWDKKIPLEKLWNEYNRLIKQNGAIVLNATQPFASELILSNKTYFRYDIIWKKNKPTGFLNANKMPLRAHEHILVFYKNLPTFNPQKTTNHEPQHNYRKKTTSAGKNYGKTKSGFANGGSTERYPISVLNFDVESKLNNKFHPTQKPIKLCEYIIKTFTNENMIVLDNCCGSGTTLIACINTKRNFIGIENNFEYYTIAQERINKICTPQ